jgi:hypothetical protein
VRGKQQKAENEQREDEFFLNQSEFGGGASESVLSSRLLSVDPKGASRMEEREEESIWSLRLGKSE